MVSLMHQRGGAGRLGEAIRLQDVEAEAVQIRPNLGIESRASRDHHPHARTDDRVDAGEDDAPDVDADAAGSAVQIDEPAEHPSR
jgi:hypothetical protein